jgi:mxaK protein
VGRLTRWATPLLWLLLAAALGAFVFSLVEWRTVARIDAAIRDRTIATMKPLPLDARALYAAAWDLERAQRFEEAVPLLTDAQASDDPVLAANAWFALGNVYFETAIKVSRGAIQDAEGAGPAELDLARDAYRAALRIDPLLHGARYNLELLERLAPVHAGAGWRRNTDPVTIQSDRHNGWTTIRESEKRGLP